MEQPLIPVSEFKAMKKKRKRRDLDKLLNGRKKIRKKSGHELLQMESGSESSDDDDLPQMYTNQSVRWFTCSSYLPFINLVVAITSCVGCAVLLWLFILTRGDLANMREQLITVGSGRHNDAEEINHIYDKLKKLKTALAKVTLDVGSHQRFLNNLTQQLSSFGTQLTKVSRVTQLKKELLEVPRKLKALEESTATIGSTVTSLRSDLQQATQRIQLLQTSISASTQSPKLSANATILTTLRQDVSQLNKTLSRLVTLLPPGVTRLAIANGSVPSVAVDGVILAPHEYSQLHSATVSLASIERRLQTLEDQSNKRTKLPSKKIKSPKKKKRET